MKHTSPKTEATEATETVGKNTLAITPKMIGKIRTLKVDVQAEIAW